MDHTNAPSLIVQLLPLIIFELVFAPIAYLLAKEKGRNTASWIVLSLIPVVNFFSLYYFIGASNLKVEAKLDEILRRVDQKA